MNRELKCTILDKELRERHSRALQVIKENNQMCQKAREELTQKKKVNENSPYELAYLQTLERSINDCESFLRKILSEIDNVAQGMKSFYNFYIESLKQNRIDLSDLMNFRIQFI